MSARPFLARVNGGAIKAPLRHCSKYNEVPFEPITVQQIGGQVAFRWNDDTESYLELELLRRACPCAACGGEPDVFGQRRRPSVSYSPASFVLEGFNPVGGYALQFRWGDGHDTGIYSFEYIRKLGRAINDL